MARKFDPDSFPPGHDTRESKLEYVIYRLLNAIANMQSAVDFATKALDVEDD